MICGKGHKEVKPANRGEYSDIRGIFATSHFQEVLFPGLICKSLHTGI